MKIFLLGLVLLVAFFQSRAQTINAEQFIPSPDSLKGKLLFITESHEVKTNLPEYVEIISKLTQHFSSVDTLNIFIEAPFTISYFINKYLESSSTILLDSILQNDKAKRDFYREIKNLNRNIRFIATDFEYDHGNAGGRLEAYKNYFYELKNILAANEIDLSVIKSFIYGIKVQGLDEADLFTFKKYIQKLSINQPNKDFKSKLKEANFVLSALQNSDNLEVRDKAVYSRILELINNGISTSGNLNLLIYGSAHANPYSEKTLYSKINYAADSPFNMKVNLFGNIYLECISHGSYNERSYVLETNGIYYGLKEDNELIKAIRIKFGPFDENSCTIYKNNLNCTLKDADRVLYWGVHYKVK